MRPIDLWSAPSTTAPGRACRPSSSSALLPCVILVSFLHASFAQAVVAADRKTSARSAAFQKNDQRFAAARCGEIKVKVPAASSAASSRVAGVSDSAGAVYAPALRHDKGRALQHCTTLDEALNISR